MWLLINTMCPACTFLCCRIWSVWIAHLFPRSGTMTGSCWFPQVIRNPKPRTPQVIRDFVLSGTGMEQVGSGYGTGSATPTLRYCVRWSGIEGFGKDLFRISGSESRPRSAFPLIPAQSCRAVAKCRALHT